MKKMKSLMMAAILCCGAGFMGSCNSNGNANADEAADDSLAVIVEKMNDIRFAAVDHFLIDSISKHYREAKVCIPCVQVVAIDEENPDSVKVWGNFWVNNYNVVGDTLKTISGGSHPGMMCLTRKGDGYVVTRFDQVADGAESVSSAKQIFGDKFDELAKIMSGDKKREKVRARQIAEYVKAYNVPVKYYQDYGWPAVEIPLK